MLQKFALPSGPISVRRSLLAGAAALSVAVATSAQADTVVLSEGQPTIQGDVDLTSGDDELFINILRAGADGTLNLGILGPNPALATGTVNTNGGADTLWLVAQGVMSQNLVNAPAGSTIAGFTGGVGYYADGLGTSLTLNPAAPGQTYKKPLLLGGTGTITIASSVQVLGDRAVQVVAPPVGEGIELHLAGTIDGTSVPDGTGLVDALNARRFVMESGSTISVIRGTALIASQGETIIADGAEILAKDSSPSANPVQNAVLVSASNGGIVRNFGSIREQGDPDAQGSETADTISTGVLLGDGAMLYNERTSAVDYGQIRMHGSAVDIRGNATVINNGLIQSDMSAAITSANADYGTSAIIRNLEGGTIEGVHKNAQNQVDDFTTAYEGGIGADLFVNGGTINGDILLGDGEDAFLAATDASGNVVGTVNGIIDGGDGNDDAFGRSFSSAGTYTASNAILGEYPEIIGFERHGIEALGAGTVATFAAAETLTNGLTLFGDGTIVNQADIATQSADGIRADDFAEGLHFINDSNAAVTATGGSAFSAQGQSLSRLENRGQLISENYGIAVGINVTAADGSWVDVINSGLIQNDGQQALVANVEGRTDAGANLRITNAGTISGGTRGVFGGSDEGAVVLVNSGSISGGTVAAQLRGESVSVANSGEIMLTPDGSNASAALLLRSQSITGTNDGMIGANVAGVDGALTAALAISQSSGGSTTFTNGANGVIEATESASVAVAASGLSSDFTLVNYGQIIGSGTDHVGAASAGGVPLSGVTTIASAIQTARTTDTIINDGSGLIFGNVDLSDGDDRFEARGNSQLQGELRLGLGEDTLLLAGGTITGMAYGGEGNDTLLIDLSQDRTIVGDNFSSFETIRRDGDGTGVLTASGTFDIDTLNLDGLTVRVAAGTTLASLGDVTVTGSDNDERLIVEGTIAGAVNLGGGDDYLDLADGGIVAGGIDGGAGNDTIGFRITADSGVEAIPDVTGFESLDVRGNHTLTLDQTFDTVTLREGADLVVTADAGTIANIIGDDSDQNVTVLGQLTGGVSLGGGADHLALMDVSGTISSGLDGGAGTDSLLLHLTGATEFSDGAQGFETITVTGAAPLTINGHFGAGQLLTFGDDDNQLVIGAGGLFEGSANGGAGIDTLTVTTNAPDSRTILAAQLQNFELLNANGTGTLALTAGSYAFDSVLISGGNLAIGTNASLQSDTGINFAAGADNRLTLGSGATISGAVDAGDGEDIIALEQGQGTVRLLSAIDGHDTFEHLESSGAGELRIDEDAAFASIHIDGGLTTIMQTATLTGPVTGSSSADRLAVVGTLAGTVDLGDGADGLEVAAGGLVAGNISAGLGDDSLTLFGQVDGAIDLGEGNDRLVLNALGSATGMVTGGAGTDTLALNTAGTYEAPTLFDASGFDSFEALEVSGGVVSLAADSSWTDLNVLGGRLIGQAGTTITSGGTIDVAHGATFGTAGTVNGNIHVLGTLSPGASPGTMTVNGDVTMGAGSNLLIEVTPASGTDLLDVNGTLTIESGAAIDITGALANMAGTTLDIVTADAISGRFTTVNKSASVFGFVVQNGNRIQIQSEFTSSENYPTNVQASIDYANQVLAGGYGVQAFTNALGVLTAADGTINQQAFSQLTPEAYGSASELGVAGALELVDSARRLRITAPAREGLYGFAQGLAGTSGVRGRATTGATSANIDNGGFIGGIGYGAGSGRFQLGAFLGRIDTDLSLAGRDAEAETDGWMAGAYADANLGGFGLHALVAYSDSDGTMSRTLLVAPTPARGRFGIRSWLADFAVDYRLDVAGVTLAPRAGISYVHTRRTAVTEEGAGAFSLAVDEDSSNSWFADLSIAASKTFDLGGIGFTPYGELGLRRMINDPDTIVSGRFAGAPDTQIEVSGAERERSAARFGLGFGMDLSKRVRFHAGYSGEFKDTDRSSFSAQATIRF